MLQKHVSGQYSAPYPKNGKERMVDCDHISHVMGYWRIYTFLVATSIFEAICTVVTTSLHLIRVSFVGQACIHTRNLTVIQHKLMVLYGIGCHVIVTASCNEAFSESSVILCKNGPHQIQSSVFTSYIMSLDSNDVNCNMTDWQRNTTSRQ